MGAGLGSVTGLGIAGFVVSEVAAGVLDVTFGGTFFAGSIFGVVVFDGSSSVLMSPTIIGGSFLVAFAGAADATFGAGVVFDLGAGATTLGSGFGCTGLGCTGLG